MPQIIDLGKIRFNFSGHYSASTFYELNDIVSYGPNNYVYINTVSASGFNVFNESYWKEFLNGFKYEGDWDSNFATGYQKQDVVTYGPKSYIAIADQVSGSVFVPTNSSYWEILSDGISANSIWTSGSVYYPGDIVKVGTSQYINNAFHSASTNFINDVNYWDSFVLGLDYKSNWVSGSSYYIGDLVQRGGSVYRSTQNHVAGNLFSTDLSAAKWQSYNRAFRWRSLWQAGESYLVDDVVTNSVDTYVAIIDHTAGSGTFGDESNRWQLFTAGTDNLPVQVSASNYVLSTNGSSAVWTKALRLGDSATLSRDNAGDVKPHLLIGDKAEEYATDGFNGENFTNPIAIITTNTDDYAQFSIINYGDGANTSTDLILYPANGNDETGWIDIGITSPTFDDPEFTITGPGDGYIFMSGPSASHSGNLVLATDATGSDNKIVFAAGGLASLNTQMEIIPDTSVHVEIATESNSPTTGALTVEGGVGIQGNLNVQGDFDLQGSITIGGGGFNSENLSLSDPFVFTNSSSVVNTNDAGIISKFGVSGSQQYVGFVKDNSDGYWKLFDSLPISTNPLSTVDFAQTVPGNLSVGDIDANNKGYKSLHAMSQSVTGSAAVVIDVSNAPVTIFNPTGSASVTFTGFPVSGYVAYWEVEVVEPLSRTIVFPGIIFDYDAAPVMPTGAGKRTVVSFRTRDGGTTINGSQSFGSI